MLDTINTDLAEFGTHVEIPYLAGVTFDYAQMMGGPKVAGEELTLAVNGRFTDANHPAESKYHPVAFDPTDL